MDALTWISAPHSQKLGVVSCGASDAFDDLIFDSKAQKPVVICDRHAGQRLSEAANMRLKSPPQIQSSQGLLRDLETGLDEATPRPAFIPGALLTDGMKHGVKAISTAADMVAGYTPPTALTDRLMRRKLENRLTELADRLRRPVVLHDPDEELATFQHPNLIRFTFGERVNGVHAREASLGFPIPTDAVRRHAHYLIETERTVLLKLHTPLPLSDYEPLYGFWYAQFEDLAHNTADQQLAQKAMAALEEIASDLLAQERAVH